MLTIRKGEERGGSNLGWLDSRHSFSFGGYTDDSWMGFRSLRVLNEDRVEPGMGFGTHPHRDMEILSYVIDGQIEHKDSLGNGSVIVPSELQRMTAGTGVTHSEFNPSPTDSLHFLQIWIIPQTEGLEPGYEQKAFPLEARRGELVLMTSSDAREGSIQVHQDISLYAGRFDTGQSIWFELAAERHGWIQVIRGPMTVNGDRLEAGDGAALAEEESIELRAEDDAEVLVFDLG